MVSTMATAFRRARIEVVCGSATAACAPLWGCSDAPDDVDALVVEGVAPADGRRVDDDAVDEGAQDGAALLDREVGPRLAERAVGVLVEGCRSGRRAQLAAGLL